MYRLWSAVWSFEFRTEDSRSIFGPRFFATSSLNIKRFCMLELSNRITFLTKLARCLPTKETISSVPAIRSKSLLVNTYAQESSFLRYPPFIIFRRKDKYVEFIRLICAFVQHHVWQEYSSLLRTNELSIFVLVFIFTRMLKRFLERE